MRLIVYFCLLVFVLAKTDYYAALELARDFSQNELDKAYKRLSNRYHPTSNPGNRDSAKRFEEIQRAHTVLSDRNLRNILSNHGEEVMKMVERHRKVGRNSDEQRTNDLHVTWKVSLEQLYNGGTINYSYNKY